MRVVVIGGGVIGLMTARELAQAGCEVVVLERGAFGHEASWAGGGIISPLYPWRYSVPVTQLAVEAQEAYPSLVVELLAETDIDAELEACGLLMLDAEDARDARLWADRHGRVLEPLDALALRQRFAGLAPAWREGLWMPTLANIRNPRLLKALLASLRQSGVILREQCGVSAGVRVNGALQSVLTEKGEHIEADAFVLCAGAWSAGLLAGLSDDEVVLPVRPVRGQMILYRLAPGQLPCMVMAEGRYVIPRRDGHVLCGSTLEESGFDKRTTVAARQELEKAAGRLWPMLARHEPVAHWAGLRPGSPNGIPFIGPVPGTARLWVNAGHHRNGLVLAPASARLLADQLLGRPVALDPRPYQI